MNTHIFEVTDTNRSKVVYLAVRTSNLSDFKTKLLDKITAHQKLFLTGNEYEANTGQKENSYAWQNELPPDAKSLQDERFDQLCRSFQSLQEQTDKIQKEIKEILKNEPDNLKFGLLYGAYDAFTLSTSLAYSELYKTAKQMLIKNEPVQKILNHLKEKEEQMSTPHKSSAKSFKVFGLEDREEITKKLYRE